MENHILLLLEAEVLKDLLRYYQNPHSTMDGKEVGFITNEILFLNRFFAGTDLPIGHHDFQLMASTDKLHLYTIGNERSGKDIYQFSCTDSINDCRWAKTETETKHTIFNLVAMTMPNASANKLCKPCPRELDSKLFIYILILTNVHKNII